MTRNQGRHRFSRRTKLTAGLAGLALATGLAVAISTTGDQGTAQADGADKSLFVDITKQGRNVKAPRPERDATTGTFGVDCGRNENGHFNPDNFIAQPGVRNGAQHLHDYVGNVTTDADSTDESLLEGDTTCKNGDKSTYFWPVVRIDTEDEGGEPGQPANAQVECPDVKRKLREVPRQARAEVDRNLTALKDQVAEANTKLKSINVDDPGAVNNQVLKPLRDKRSATINRIADAIDRVAQRPRGLQRLAPCTVKDGDAEDVKVADEQREAEPDAPEKGDGKSASDENELPGNEGDIQRPEVVDISFRGSPVGKVTAMPQFLRVLYGDAKVSTNGTKNARNSWTCTGFEDKVLINKYPICPQGSKVKRVHDFASCWDGKNTDSANHRDHIVYPDQNGRCPKGFRAVPQLRISLTYNIPRDVQANGQYAVDAFPEEEHNPFSDHDDFANVMSDEIMQRVVNCINSGKKCRE
ncbi:DUF1996 domain-containing protein [Actinosynnema sp. NPDC047251]|uniref:DUF1996 domain-containing protein n=1 Tax=Saccharothrix espanaensis (strain ATCC 51144 / DSM 44229 / JCM 9112 / NBRC 15066 / NRRL 15764) TaxID=1179773 RepID=K0K158_SACES|nr:DUF1996 domain-containing protein [Saccharothrix espanaensis]CCH30313.1 hypothetical protein BN6_30060 [Saccharothrix espanaensis DSM 44229]